jgi:GH15 family glucan-1,4-alpha-glucosidase
VASTVLISRPLARDGSSLSADPQAPLVRAERRDRGRPDASLPEQIGGTRNWDYRYAWLRDFAFSIYALSRLGFVAEALAFNGFGRRISSAAAARDGGSPLDVTYQIDGDRCLAECELVHLEGYRGSRPVRIGNGAASCGAGADRSTSALPGDGPP